MTFNDFLILFNEIAQLESKGRATPATNLADGLTELGLDSMDQMMLGIFFCDWWGIDEKRQKTIKPKTLGEFYDALILYGTKEPESVKFCINDYKDFTCS